MIYHCSVCGADVFGHPGRTSTIFCNDCSFERARKTRTRRSGSNRLKKKLIKKYGRVCQKCGKEGNVMLHHITPINQGGRNNQENSVLLCQDCHKLEHGGRGVGLAGYE